MERVVAVEGNLSPFKEFLAAQGCRVMELDSARSNRVDAIVVSGSDQNLMGMEDILIKAPVISARGRTPEDVWNEIQKKP